jgi:hypothetical protein
MAARVANGGQDTMSQGGGVKRGVCTASGAEVNVGQGRACGVEGSQLGGDGEQRVGQCMDVVIGGHEFT